MNTMMKNYNLYQMLELHARKLKNYEFRNFYVIMKWIKNYKTKKDYLKKEKSRKCFHKTILAYKKSLTQKDGNRFAVILVL